MALYQVTSPPTYSAAGVHVVAHGEHRRVPAVATPPTRASVTPVIVVRLGSVDGQRGEVTIFLGDDIAEQWLGDTAAAMLELRDALRERAEP